MGPRLRAARSHVVWRYSARWDKDRWPADSAVAGEVVEGDAPEFTMSCEQDVESSRYVVTVMGDIEYATVPALRDFLLALDGDVDVNCEAVTFLDSAGIGLFAHLQRHLTNQGRRLRLRRLRGNCYKLLEIAGLVGYLDAEADTA
jgi:anti-anti-sigma factor